MSASLEVWWAAAIVAAGFALYQMHVYWRNQREIRNELDRRSLTTRIDHLTSELSQASLRIDVLESRNASLSQSVNQLAALFVRAAPQASDEAVRIVEALTRNLRGSGVSITTQGDATIGGDVTGRDRAGG